MNSNSSSSSARGRRRRGGRRNYSDRQPERPAKLTFWQRILSLFNGGKKPGVSSQKSVPTQHPTLARANGASASDPDVSRERDRERERRSRRPEIVEVTTPRLYVGNLSFEANDDDLRELFSGVGIVASAEVVTHRGSDRSKGFAFVQMQTVEEARRAVRELHDKPFMGRSLSVSGAKLLEPRQAA